LENVELCISDGSEHIMNTIFAPLFPNATHILDYYHKAEALHSCLKEVNGQEERKGEVANFLWNGQINNVIDELKLFQEIIGIPSGKRIPEDPKVKIDNLIKHFDSNKEKLLYDRFRLLKYPIGSGCIESAVKLFGKRVKGTEKQWNTEGGEAILQLYSFLISEDERWNKLWEVQRPWV